MSSGVFTLAQYSTDNSDIVPIRVQPETLEATLGTVNASATGTLSPGFPSAQVSQSKRALGINARTVSIRFDPGEEPTDYKPGTILRVPVTTKARFDALSKGSAVTYLGATGQVAGKSPERIN
jgi:hypothetical protein